MTISPTALGARPLSTILPLGVHVDMDAVEIMSGALAIAGEIHAKTYGRSEEDIHAILIAHAFVVAEIIRAQARTRHGNKGTRWWTHWFHHALKEALAAGDGADLCGNN